MATIRTDCRCCRGVNLVEVFNLGEQPFANRFLTQEQLAEPEPKSPLILMECADCGMVQLKHVADADGLYRTYSFLTSSSRVMVQHFGDLMNENVARFVPYGGLVVEIGSNDGSALVEIARGDVRKIGVDPAENIADIANSRGIRTIAKFFSADVAREILEGSGDANLIVACNVVGHIDNLDEFCRGVKTLLRQGGALIIEVPNVDCLVKQTEFTTVYHEHLSSFSLRAFVALLHRHGLSVENIEHQDVHGGSMRLTIRHGLRVYGSTGLVADWLANDRLPRDWPAFNRRCEMLRARLCWWLLREAREDRTVWGYCASAKATVLLNYCGIGTDLLPIVVDSTSLKQGHFMPGTHQPILPTTEVRRQRPDSVLVLAPNHFAEISEKESEYRAAGGRLVTVNNLEEIVHCDFDQLPRCPVASTATVSDPAQDASA